MTVSDPIGLRLHMGCGEPLHGRFRAILRVLPGGKTQEGRSRTGLPPRDRVRNRNGKGK